CYGDLDRKADGKQEASGSRTKSGPGEEGGRAAQTGPTRLRKRLQWLGWMALVRHSFKSCRASRTSRRALHPSSAEISARGLTTSTHSRSSIETSRTPSHRRSVRVAKRSTKTFAAWLRTSTRR